MRSNIRRKVSENGAIRTCLERMYLHASSLCPHVAWECNREGQFPPLTLSKQSPQESVFALGREAYTFIHALKQEHASC